MEFLLVKAPPNTAGDFLMPLLDILVIFTNFSELFYYSFKGLRKALSYNSITTFRFRGDWQMYVCVGRQSEKEYLKCSKEIEQSLTSGQEIWD